LKQIVKKKYKKKTKVFETYFENPKSEKKEPVCEVSSKSEWERCLMSGEPYGMDDGKIF